ncbi:MAG: tRNA epoxyqueuosine(34) reductase QueG [Planctomycetaceae bacterium]|jgi:epoxyqueuosine reductase|nr:tRNA epoxyqueuosine(34) reductase QueG [Planctomycetaceae bacterium]
MSITPSALLLDTACNIGFDLAGIIPAASPKTFDFFARWLDSGMHAGQQHFVRHFNLRKHPDSLLPGVKSIMMLAVSYGKVLSDPHPIQALTGIAEYARGADYHCWIKSRLAVLAKKHAELFPGGRCRGTCDTAPILEKQFAADAGLGNFGKNTLIIHPKYGSKMFLSAFLSTERLEPVPLPPGPFDLCGDCRVCLDACPTGALVAPYVLDSRRCLSYWTLVHRGEIPADIEAKRGNCFLGCDVCQKVCPHNAGLPELPPGMRDPLQTDSAEILRLLRGSPLG